MCALLFHLTQPGDGTEVDQSPDTVQSLELSAQKKGRPRLSSNSSGGSSGSKKLGRPRKNSADSLTKSSTKKRRKVLLNLNGMLLLCLYPHPHCMCNMVLVLQILLAYFVLTHYHAVYILYVGESTL